MQLKKTMNKIKIDLENIIIELPENKIIVEREEYDELKRESNKEIYLSLNQVLKMLSVSRPWLIENVLYNPKIRAQIDINHNKNGFVKYPTNKGGRYYFHAKKTRKFFEENFEEILAIC